MTVAAILTVAVSLALVGSSLLLKQGASKATVQWQNGVQTIVWVKPDGRTHPHRVHRHRARSVALRQDVHLPEPGLRLQRGQAHPRRPTSSTPPAQADYPSSYRCVLNDPSQAPAVYQAFIGKPGRATTSSTRASRSRPCRA